jgi:hypothetical protein
MGIIAGIPRRTRPHCCSALRIVIRVYFPLNVMLLLCYVQCPAVLCVCYSLALLQLCIGQALQIDNALWRALDADAMPQALL